MFQMLAKPDFAALILRLILAAIFICQGGLKILEAQGGTAWFVGADYLIPPVVQAIVAWTELVCGIALLLGILTRVASIGIIIIMIGAIFMVTFRREFTSLSTSRGFLIEVGYEYNYAIIAICASLVVLGAGALSLDYCLFGRKAVVADAAATPTPVGEHAH